MTERKKRVKQTAEIFTPSWLVNQMLDKLIKYGPESFEKNKTFLDPACGTGNMLIEVIKRKIKYGHNPLTALQTIYGTDIMQDNINECRLRLLRIVGQHDIINQKHVKTVLQNIICTPLTIYPKGSLDYDFEFNHSVNPNEVEELFGIITMDNWMAENISQY